VNKEHFLARYGEVDTPENHEFMKAIGSYKDHPKWAKNRNNFERASRMVENPKAPVEFARHSLDADYFNLQHAALRHPGLTPEDLAQHLASNRSTHFIALRHPNVSTKQLDDIITGSGLNSSDRASVGLAVQHPNVAKHHIDWAVNHPDAKMRAHVALRHDLEPHHRQKLNNDFAQVVRAASGIGSMPKKDRHESFKTNVRGFLDKNNLVAHDY
jgi:hypothetical protein